MAWKAKQQLELERSFYNTGLILKSSRIIRNPYTYHWLVIPKIIPV